MIWALVMEELRFGESSLRQRGKLCARKRERDSEKNKINGEREPGGDGNKDIMEAVLEAVEAEATASASTASATSVTHLGMDLEFPFPPYDCQVHLASKAAECFSQGQDGLLESPTGTGKTLALLSAAIAWIKKSR